MAEIDSSRRFRKKQNTHRAILHNAKILFEHEGGNDAVAFHCQQSIEKALKAEPENGAHLDSLGWVSYKKQDYKKAYKQITEALKYMPEEKVLQGRLEAVKKAMGK